MSRKSIDQRLSQVPLFSALSKADQKRIRSLMTPITIKAGRELTTEGKAGNEFMIILEGSATVRRKGRKVNTLGSGDWVGEISLILGSPRTATVTADTDLLVEVMGKREFTSLLDQEPSIARKIMSGLAARVRELDSLALH